MILWVKAVLKRNVAGDIDKEYFGEIAGVNVTNISPCQDYSCPDDQSTEIIIIKTFNTLRGLQSFIR